MNRRSHKISKKQTNKGEDLRLGKNFAAVISKS